MMDVFTDVDLLCDLMEASNKRKVPVYILLDEKNLVHFADMCSALDIQNSHLGVSLVLVPLKTLSCGGGCSRKSSTFSFINLQLQTPPPSL